MLLSAQGALEYAAAQMGVDESADERPASRKSVSHDLCSASFAPCSMSAESKMLSLIADASG